MEERFFAGSCRLAGHWCLKRKDAEIQEGCTITFLYQVGQLGAQIFGQISFWMCS